MKYKCLVLDHDDTVVNSTATINYPAFKSFMKIARPDIDISLEKFFELNFSPGFSRMCSDILNLNEEEMQLQYDIWQKAADSQIPELFSGMKKIIEKFKKNGGILVVSSHSFSKTINEHYLYHFGFKPDLVFGWDLEESQRKPFPFAIKESMSKFNLLASDILMIDDLKPGFEMARSCNVDFAWAGWSHDIQEIKDFMEMKANYSLFSTNDLAKILF